MFKKKVKQDYIVTLIRIDGLENYEGKEVVVKWRRGKKEGNKGKFKPVKVQYGAIKLDSDAVVNLHCTLFEKQKAGFFEEKLIEFSVNTSDGKKISAGVIDLAQYVGLNGDTKEVEIGMKGKKKSDGMLYAGIISMEGVSTGYSENTEVLVLTDDDEDGMKGEIAERLREQEDIEEEELRKRQLQERDSMNNEGVAFDVADKGSSKKKSKKDKEKAKKEKKEKKEREKREKKEKKQKKKGVVVQVEDDEDNSDNVVVAVDEFGNPIEDTPAAVEKEPSSANIDVSVAVVVENETDEKKSKSSSSEDKDKEEKEEEPKSPQELLEEEEQKQYEEYMKERRTFIQIIKEIKKLEFEKNIINGYKTIAEIICANLTPLIDACLFTQRTVEEINTSEVEQITSKVILKSIKNYSEVLSKHEYEQEIINRIVKQIFHHLSYYVLDYLFDHTEHITCAKGYQLKFFMMYMNTEMLTNNEYTNFKEQFEQMNLITDISNVFMQHHCISVDEIETLFPTLSNNIIFKLLSNYHADETDISDVKKEFLDELQQKCTEDIIPSRFTFVA